MYTKEHKLNIKYKEENGMGGYVHHAEKSDNLEVEDRRNLCARQAEALGSMSVAGLKVEPGVLDAVLQSRGLGHLAVSVLPERVETTMIVEALDVLAGKYAQDNPAA